MNEGWFFLAIAALAPMSVFFGLNGLALRSFSRLKLQEAFRRAGREALMEDFLGHAEQLTITCGTLRVMANTSLIFLLAAMLGRTHFWAALVLTIVVIELLTLIIPHAWAKHTGEYILPRTYGCLKVCMILIRPLWALFKLHDTVVQRLAGIRETNPEQDMEERQEQILSMVEQGKIEGVVDEEELEMIENVLELDETCAEEIMTPRTDLVGVEVHDSLEKIMETIRDKGHSRIPVYEETIDRITGLIYAKDLLTEIGKDPSTFKLADKVRKPYFVPESKPLRDLLREFQQQKLHIAVVLDEYGGTAGIVTIEDILEEVVGEITDEYETTPAESYRQIDETTYEVDARMYIDEVNEALDVELPEDEDYDTVGGFVFSSLGYIPKVGEHFRHEDLTISVTAAGPRVVKKLRIKKNPPDEPA